MKTKKLFCLILCVSVIFSFSTIMSFAEEIKLDYVTSVSQDVLVDEVYFPEKSNNVPYLFYSNLNNSWKFYDVLNSEEKAIYDAIIQAQAGITTDGVISIEVPVGVIKSDNINSAVPNAISAIIDDYPEYFWVGGYSRSGYYPVYSGSTAWVTSFSITFSLNTSNYASWDVVRSCYGQLMDADESFVVPSGSRYTKVKSIHDQICKINTYQSGPMAHEPTGVFINGSSVCEGYAEAFKLICDRENIPCISVVGTGNGGAHKWNYVQMEDRKWYGVDVTWDDQDTIYYDFFLVGSETLNCVFGGSKFGNGVDSAGDHINTGTHFSGSSFALTYPTIATQSYSGVLPMWDSKVTFDANKSFIFFGKNDNIKSQIVCTNTGYGYLRTSDVATITGTTTGGKLKITSPVSKTYTLVRWGDVNADGSTNSADNNIILSTVKGETQITDTAKFNAADYNQDGVIDMFDVFYSDLYVNNNKLINE